MKYRYEPKRLTPQLEARNYCFLNRYSTVYSLYTTAAAQKHFRRLLPHPQLFAGVWALPRQKPMQKLPQLRLPNWLLHPSRRL